jgi:CDP-diacylglycerol--glycerol-3-phosphate 3-phosphatidyltransferase
VHVRQSSLGVSLVLMALLGSFMVSYASAKAEALRAQIPRGAMRRPERAAYLIVGAALTPIVAPFVAAHVEDAPGWLLESPALGAVALVALVANVSAVRRLSKLAAAVGGPRAQPTPVVIPLPTRAAETTPAGTRAAQPVATAREPEALVHVDAAR